MMIELKTNDGMFVFNTSHVIKYGVYGINDQSIITTLDGSETVVLIKYENLCKILVAHGLRIITTK